MSLTVRRRLVRVVLCTAVATLGAAGCGSSGTSAQTGIAKLSQRFATTARAKDYDAQCGLYTAAARADLVAAAAGLKRRPVPGCVVAAKLLAEAASRGPIDLSRPVVYSHVEASGDHATADDPDGQPTRFRRVHGTWLFASDKE